MLGDHLTRGRSLMSQRRPSTLVDGNNYNNNYNNNYDNYYNDYNNNFSDLEEMNNLLGDHLTRGRSLTRGGERGRNRVKFYFEVF